MTAGTYFPGEEPRLTALLDDFLARLSADLGEQPFAAGVRALLLAGGYGRGEGGIFRAAENAHTELYNDLEFYAVIAEGADAGEIEEWCAVQAHRGEAQIGIEVEFKVLREGALRGGEPSMFYYDLLAAHRLVHGAPEFIAALPARLRDPKLIPLHEATRLLFNRGTGLFYSRVALERNDPRATSGFVERNHAKTRLALADAVLAVNGRYAFSCRERHRRLAEPLAKVPPGWPEIAAWHEAGVDFKLHPRHRHPAAAELLNAQAVLSAAWLRTFLWLESLRLGARLDSAAAYASHGGRLFPKTKRARNFALHLRDRLLRGSALPSWFDYPRAALQRTLVTLVSTPPDDAAAARRLGLPPAAPLHEIHDRYERWWKFYN